MIAQMIKVFYLPDQIQESMVIFKNVMIFQYEPVWVTSRVLQLVFLKIEISETRKKIFIVYTRKVEIDIPSLILLVQININICIVLNCIEPEIHVNILSLVIRGWHDETVMDLFHFWSMNFQIRNIIFYFGCYYMRRKGLNLRCSNVEASEV